MDVVLCLLTGDFEMGDPLFRRLGVPLLLRTTYCHNVLLPVKSFTHNAYEIVPSRGSG